MIFTDATKRKLKVGQIVDVCLMGMYKAKVVDIKESPIFLTAQQQIPPHAVFQLVMPSNFGPDGSTLLYILEEPDPNDPIVIEHEEKSKGKKIVRVS